MNKRCRKKKLKKAIRSRICSIKNHGRTIRITTNVKGGQAMKELSPHQGFGLMVVMIALIGVYGVLGRVEQDTLTLEHGIYISIALLIIMVVGALLINFNPKEDKLHINKKARQVGKPNRADKKLIQFKYRTIGGLNQVDKKKWNALSRDMLPLLEKMTEVLKKHEYEKIFSPAISADGYIHAYHIEGDEHYRLYKVNSNYSADIELKLDDYYGGR